MARASLLLYFSVPCSSITFNHGRNILKVCFLLFSCDGRAPIRSLQKQCQLPNGLLHYVLNQVKKRVLLVPLALRAYYNVVLLRGKRRWVTHYILPVCRSLHKSTQGCVCVCVCICDLAFNCSEIKLWFSIVWHLCLLQTWNHKLKAIIVYLFLFFLFFLKSDSTYQSLFLFVKWRTHKSRFYMLEKVQTVLFLSR